MSLSRRLAHRLLSLLLTGSLGGLLTGCEFKMPPMPWDPPQAAEETKHAEGAEASAEEESMAEEGEFESEPLDMGKLLPPAMRDLPYEEVAIPMGDGLQIVGRLYDPSMYKDEDGEVIVPALEVEDEYEGVRYPLVILLHGLNHSQANWRALPAQLVKAGYGVFAMDLRGHGQSVQGSRGRRVNWRMLTERQWSSLYRDVDQVIEFFSTGEEYPQIDGHRVALIGEGLGANTAILSARRNSHVKALVLLSPEMSIKGMDAARAMVDFPKSTMILVNEDSRESYVTGKQLFGWITGHRILQIYQKVGYGADMLLYQPTIGEHIRDWMKKEFPVSPEGQPAEESHPDKG